MILYTFELKTIDNFVEIAVSDQGVGISKKELRNLFQWNINHSHNGTANEHGTGLGLLICKDFVEKHGCKI